MNQLVRRYLFFVSKPYSFAILEPLQHYLEAETRGTVRWFLASTARDFEAPGEILATPAEVRDYQPEAVLAPGNVVPPSWPGLKVQIFHGLDDEVKGFYNINGLFDLYCTHGPAMTNRYNSLASRYRYFLVRETGWPKLDPLAHPQNSQLMRRELGLDPQQPVLLYAPTFPRKYTSAPELLNSIARLSGGPYFWLVKFHPLMDEEIVDQYRVLCGENFLVVDDLNILPYMQAADILITDTSSVAYEFLLLDRPLITYRTLARQDKGIDLTQPSELEQAIERCMRQPQEFSAPRAAYLSELHPYTDGESSSRVVSAIEEVLDQDLHQQLHRKPLNLIRRLKVHRMLAT
ncbi:MAG: CDP-glycerol glycerophosphotransferase family protein [Fidelibacterota bacterium]|nr:MAG: CDP-glycerol glycerophosphotransferase family protein [Candidatus Neomarinimicrobiota bacterium]